MNEIKKIVIVGGGTAGWITAGVLANEYAESASIEITLIESPNISPIGVGEGTWPSMRSTLQRIGVSEYQLVAECDASFKQGSTFINWGSDSPSDSYFHPFSLPEDFFKINLVKYWQAYSDKVSFADAVCSQSYLIDKFLAPKQVVTPEFAGVTNYGYHLDATKFSNLVKNRCINDLGVKFISDHISHVNSDDQGYITSVLCDSEAEINGDLFIDCSGLHALLVGKHYDIPFVSKNNILFNDKAIAVQIPYDNNSAPINSSTRSTGQSSGWIWDIGLSSRRGVGHVYSSSHTSSERALEELKCYVKKSSSVDFDSLNYREIDVNPGFREKIWHKNCVAVGMASGFLEPLEASALVMVELSAAFIAENLPVTRSDMEVVEHKFNDKFRYRWERIIDFLKLHYVLTKRKDSDYWQDNIAIETIPDSLLNNLNVWKHRFPRSEDFTRTEELFPSASYQYVLYGMGFKSNERERKQDAVEKGLAEQKFSAVIENANQYVKALPTNRELTNSIINKYQ